MSYARKNLVWLLVSQSATWVVSFVLLISVPNLLDQRAYGALAFSLTFVSYFSLLAGLETGQLLTKEIARDPDLLSPYVRNGLTMKIVVSLVLLLLALAVGWMVGLDRTTLGLVAFGCIGMAFATLNSVLQGALGGVQRMARPAMWVVVQLYVGAIVGILVLALGASVVAFAAVLAAAASIPLAANLWAIRPLIHGAWRPEVATWRKLVSGGIPLLALTGLNLLYGTIDVAILNGLTGEEAVALYTVAYRWAGVPIFICTAVIGAYFPLFSAYAKSTGPDFARTVNKALRLVVLVAAPAAFGLWSIADDVIRTIHGADYADSVPAMRILIWQVPIAALNTVLGAALVASDRIRPAIFVAAGASVLTPIALIVAIRDLSPRSACIAAALVSTATEVYVFSGAVRFRACGVLDRTTVSWCARCVLGAATIPIALWPLRDLPFPVSVPVGCAAYVTASIALRVVSTRDLLRVRETLRSVLRPTAPRSEAATRAVPGQ